MYTLKIDDPSKLYFTSDLHLNHFNIAKYCNRPFENRAEMNKALMNNWNSIVPEDGIVINCGDLTLYHKENFAEYIKIASNLNGKQLLIRGNHDKVPLTTSPSGNFIAIVDIATIVVENFSVTASHYPLLAFPTNYAVHGHVHTLSDGKIHGLDADVTERMRINQYDVGVDQNNYKPISYYELMQIFNKRK